MRITESKLHSAVFYLRYETWKTNRSQQYLIDDAKREKQTATTSIKNIMRNLKYKLQPAVFT